MACCEATLEEHVGVCNSVRWSPDGRLLGSGGSDGSVILWAKDASREALLRAELVGRAFVSVSAEGFDD